MEYSQSSAKRHVLGCVKLSLAESLNLIQAFLPSSFTSELTSLLSAAISLNINFRSVRRDLLRSKQRICDDYLEEEHRDSTLNNGHAVKGDSNGYTRLSQSDDSAINLLLQDGEDEDWKVDEDNLSDLSRDLSNQVPSYLRHPSIWDSYSDKWVIISDKKIGA